MFWNLRLNAQQFIAWEDLIFNKAWILCKVLLVHLFHVICWPVFADMLAISKNVNILFAILIPPSVHFNNVRPMLFFRTLLGKFFNVNFGEKDFEKQSNLFHRLVTKQILKFWNYKIASKNDYLAFLVFVRHYNIYHRINSMMMIRLYWKLHLSLKCNFQTKPKVTRYKIMSNSKY